MMGREGDASELLDLVRSAEQGAFVSTTPSGNPVLVEEEFVDVGDEATDATPSTPLRLPTPLQMRVRTPPVARALPAAIPAAAVTPPAVGIIVLLALAIGLLAVLTR